ncbi:oligopeptide/dipeptide ABC transporter ATP-binding protein [Friedmanniella endophytica]|uniref:Oligopeptide/dipeptide ABC transporter ATP-binding protein n=1 Tax=Microlunatus kandeliicorticis TaxID=1759536 RepID=A0A7W3IQ52_9ACTN|nr:ABC transporter ATP-binding protein [Microlunatus kandeliicorticis]MBA8793193.1 oligopeptide/dipeptide ABC transporter ATP-binding protein [Microlunatus kandeliicorticis]
MTLLEVQHVTHSYPTSPRPVLRDVSLEVVAGDVVAVVGESGCGKTTMGRLIAGLTEPSQGKVAFDGSDIWSLKGRAKKDWRRRVQLVHQDPYGSLNPGLTLGSTLAPGMLYHKLATPRTVDQAMLEVLEQVGLDPTKEFLQRYPHQLSGGQRQRLSIARAISLRPDLVVADEVTSMLDVSMRVAILDLLLKFRAERGIGFVFISHDFGVVRYFTQGGRIAVMFFGSIVEVGPTDEVVTAPKHPYTQMLLQAIPVPNPALARQREAEEAAAGGETERLIGEPSWTGCVFANRCPLVQDVCRTTPPPLQQVKTDDGTATQGHQAACHFSDRIPPLRYLAHEGDGASNQNGARQNGVHESAGGSGSHPAQASVG